LVVLIAKATTLLLLPLRRKRRRRRRRFSDCCLCYYRGCQSGSGAERQSGLYSRAAWQWQDDGPEKKREEGGDDTLLSFSVQLLRLLFLPVLPSFVLLLDPHPLLPLLFLPLSNRVPPHLFSFLPPLLRLFFQISDHLVHFFFLSPCLLLLPPKCTHRRTRGVGEEGERGEGRTKSTVTTQADLAPIVKN